MSLPLGTGCAEIHCARPEQLEDGEVAALGCVLSADERERAARFLLEGARRSFVVTRALLRQSLSLYADVPPNAWVFTRGPHGKPRVAAPDGGRDLCFNVSHTRGFCVCIVAGSEVGIDVQYTGRPPPWRVLDRYLAPSEQEHLRCAPEAERAARFFEYWTLKEAYVKARGFGFGLPLSQIGFSREGAETRLLLGPRINDDPRRWSLKTWRATPEHQIAIAIERSCEEGASDSIGADDAIWCTWREGFDGFDREPRA
jgi:4'-phosphopantetheinyl transferase